MPRKVSPKFLEQQGKNGGWHGSECFKEKECVVCKTKFKPTSGSASLCSDICRGIKRKEAIKKSNSTEVAKQRRLDWNKNNKAKKNALTYKRRTQQLNAFPSWANEFFIEEAYHLAHLRTKLFGFSWHVDHIIPLQGKTVCGLHVENNLQVIPGKINLSKGNKHAF